MKRITGYKNYYVNENGEVFRLYKTVGFKQLKPRLNSKGYLKVCLVEGLKQKEELVHRLVCKAFKRIGAVRKIVNHINNIKTDNRLENLEFVTQSENLKHYFKNFYVKKVK